MRILIPWAGVEPLNGVYNWSIVDYMVNAAYKRNMGVLGVLNSTPRWAVTPGQPAIAAPPANTQAYADFAAQVAKRYAGKVSAYEIWNEGNTGTLWAPQPNPVAYTRMLQAAYPAIKAADPNATVVAGGFISVADYGNVAVNPVRYVQQMYAAGAKGNFDAISFHPYQFTLPFTQGPTTGPYANISPRGQLALIHQTMVANGNGNKLIWASEYVEPTSVASEATQASYIQNFLNGWSKISYAGPPFIYTTEDRNSASTSANDTFGLLRDDWSRKPAANVIQQWTATHPQTAPTTVTLTAATGTASTTTASTSSTPTAVAPVAATAVPQNTLTATAPTTETATAPTATSTATAPTGATGTSSTTGTSGTSSTTGSSSTSRTTGTSGSTTGSGSSSSTSSSSTG